MHLQFNTFITSNIVTYIDKNAPFSHIKIVKKCVLILNKPHSPLIILYIALIAFTVILYCFSTSSNASSAPASSPARKISVIAELAL